MFPSVYIVSQHKKYTLELKSGATVKWHTDWVRAVLIRLNTFDGDSLRGERNTPRGFAFVRF